MLSIHKSLRDSWETHPTERSAYGTLLFECIMMIQDFHTVDFFEEDVLDKYELENPDTDLDMLNRVYNDHEFINEVQAWKRTIRYGD
jgi:hypothetical protein